uniref:Uncharacterized protein n=1 Tax=Anguilla anguilla TaxID=7936 RepID=A0A0E9VYH0_ANGAN
MLLPVEFSNKRRWVLWLSKATFRAIVWLCLHGIVSYIVTNNLDLTTTTTTTYICLLQRPG